jgi:glycosyltransferase involved in cell wall biosynthesis
MPHAPAPHDEAAPLRIAMVTETWPPEVNGVAATAARLVQGLRDHGHAVDLVRPRQAGDIGCNDIGCNDTLALMRSMPLPRYPELRMGLPARGALIARWRRRRPDVVHLVTEGPLGWSALWAAQRLALPVVSDFRTNFHAYSAHYGLGWLARPVQAVLRSFHNRTACTMVPTEALRRELASAGFQRLRVVARGVDARQFTPARRSEALRARWGAGPDTLVALCVGRLAPEKNLGAVLEAAAAMRAVHPAARLVLVGDGPERARLAQRAPDAVFAGQRTGDDLAAHYASADVFLFPSLTETFGNVVPEAMASGLAVLAFDLAAAGQLIRQGDNGLLAAPGDAAAFCRLAATLAGDAEQVRALGLQARASATALDWARITQAVEAEYRAAIAGASGWQPAGWRAAMPAA